MRFVCLNKQKKTLCKQNYHSNKDDIIHCGFLRLCLFIYYLHSPKSSLNFNENRKIFATLSLDLPKSPLNFKGNWKIKRKKNKARCLLKFFLYNSFQINQECYIVIEFHYFFNIDVVDLLRFICIWHSG